MADASKAARRLALCPGSFDPLTLGHVEMVRRARTLFDNVIVAVLRNPAKQSLFTVDERVDIAREVFADDADVEVDAFAGLLVEYAAQRGACAIVRGVRGVTDFEYEWPMAQMNRELAPGVETVLLVPSPRVSAISSTLVKEIASMGGDVSAFVPPSVFARVCHKVRGRP
jgi:pantetheine-phosphate adenylyltransferase